jgi:hypothetical protein
MPRSKSGAGNFLSKPNTAMRRVDTRTLRDLIGPLASAETLLLFPVWHEHLERLAMEIINRIMRRAVHGLEVTLVTFCVAP